LAGQEKVQNPSNCRKIVLKSFSGGRGLTRAITGKISTKGLTVHSARYSEMLCEKLKLAIRSKRRGLLSEGVVLLHDSTCLHTAAHTVETLKKINFEVMEYPPYRPHRLSPDWTTSTSLKRPSVYHGPATEGNGACVACLSA
jgi:hypothetical protein